VLATLEYFIHVDPLSAPAGPHVSFRVTVADDVPVEWLDRERLPRGWRDYPAPASLGTLGADWARSLRTVALLVPSAVTPIEDNVLLNPRHPDMVKIAVGTPQPFAFDPRMFK
jgi:RES domain-containing protein